LNLAPMTIHVSPFFGENIFLMQLPRPSQKVIFLLRNVILLVFADDTLLRYGM
jgi:hypothetical protein